MNVRAGRFPLFDSLRAMAALGVVAFHAALFAGIAKSDSVLRPYTAHLDVGVTIFFLVSGFLLYRPFVRARMLGEPPPSTGVYAWRRFLRIVPAYWVALTVVAVALGLSEVFTARGIATYYGFAQIYSAETAPGGIDQAWTLCVEVAFYAFLPLWALLMRATGRERAPARALAIELGALALLFCASLAYKVWALGEVDPQGFESAPYLMPLPNFLDDFAVGMGLAVLSVWCERREELPGPLRLVARFPALPWLVAAIAFWAVSTRIGFTGVPGDPVSPKMFLGRHELYLVIATGVILPAVFGEPERGLVRRLLGSRALLFVGLVSYALYLYHLAVLTFFDRRAHDWLWSTLPDAVGWRLAGYLLIGTAGGLALATLSYYVVERPALRLKDRFGPAAPPSREEAIGEPAPAGPAPASATAASTTSEMSAGWRKRGTP